MAHRLLEMFPNPDDLLGLEPEELGDAILEIAPHITQNGMFNLDSLRAQFFQSIGQSYPFDMMRPVANALAEALSRLVSLGLLFEDPEQPISWYRMTRRAQSLKTRADVGQFRRGRILPAELLPPTLAEKVLPLFLRGDPDIAVFQAFKEVEVAVRKAANMKGAGYPDDLVGVALMRKAFHPETGPLRNTEAAMAEREAECSLFAGAIGHAKNPTSHRDVGLPAQAAARLTVFAGHLLGIVEDRL
jgi:hypothetical protein